MSSLPSQVRPPHLYAYIRCGMPLQSHVHIHYAGVKAQMEHNWILPQGGRHCKVRAMHKLRSAGYRAGRAQAQTAFARRSHPSAGPATRRLAWTCVCVRRLPPNSRGRAGPPLSYGRRRQHLYACIPSIHAPPDMHVHVYVAPHPSMHSCTYE